MANLTGTAGDDILVGTDLDDILGGFNGADKMIGGNGSDIYYVDNSKDIVSELAGKGKHDVVHASISHILSANVEDLTLIGNAADGTGNSLDNIIIGNVLTNKLDGGAGNDTLDGGTGNDTLIGGAGDDKYSIDAGDTIIEKANGGIDSVYADFFVDLSQANFSNVENVYLQGTGFVSANGNALNNRLEGNSSANNLEGQAGHDYLLGGAGADVLVGDDGNDILDGGDDVDQMTGGRGNDVYYVTSALDLVTEIANEGIDEVRSGNMDLNLANYAGVENIALFGSIALTATGDQFANQIIGNDGANVLRGGMGNDTLVGGIGADELFGDAGNDKMMGGIGDDKYHVESSTDVVTEKLNEGNDTVFTSLTGYTLGSNLENLKFEGVADLDGTGNALRNVMTGNDGKNHLDGAAGNDYLDGGIGDDTLIGGAGDDTLYGGTGGDTMTGGAGNDTYNVDSEFDKINELANGGIDTIEASISISLVGLQFVENVLFQGATNLSAEGNTLGNYIHGNGGGNVLEGGLGNDTLFGNQGDDQLFGGGGNDVIEGWHGADTMTSGEGNDMFLYRVDTAFPLVALNLISGDTIADFEHGNDQINLHDLFNNFGITSTNPVADGYLKLEAVMGSNDVTLRFDSDGMGPEAFVTLATLKNAPDVTIADIII